MKGKPTKKGGKRKGAGRKPSGVTKEAVTIYTDVSRFGGREGARMAIYEFLDGKINFTGDTSFVPLEWPIETHEAAKTKVIASLISQSQAVALHNAENPDQSTEAYNISKKKAEALLKPVVPPGFEAQVSEAAQKQIREDIARIKAERCPPERDTPIGRKSWQIDQQKRIQELQNKLK